MQSKHQLIKKWIMIILNIIMMVFICVACAQFNIFYLIHNSSGTVDFSKEDYMNYYIAIIICFGCLLFWSYGYFRLLGNKVSRFYLVTYLVTQVILFLSLTSVWIYLYNLTQGVFAWNNLSIHSTALYSFMGGWVVQIGVWLTVTYVAGYKHRKEEFENRVNQKRSSFYTTECINTVLCLSLVLFGTLIVAGAISRMAEMAIYLE